MTSERTLQVVDTGVKSPRAVPQLKNIVSGRFRENSEVMEGFDDLESWIKTRIPQALESMDEMGMLSSPAT